MEPITRAFDTRVQLAIFFEHLPHRGDRRGTPDEVPVDLSATQRIVEEVSVREGQQDRVAKSVALHLGARDDGRRHWGQLNAFGPRPIAKVIASSSRSTKRARSNRRARARDTSGSKRFADRRA